MCEDKCKCGGKLAINCHCFIDSNSYIVHIIEDSKGVPLIIVKLKHRDKLM